MRSSISSYFSILRQMVRLLYRSHPRALVISAASSLTEPLFYPALLLLLQQLFERLTGPQGAAQFSLSAVPIGAGIAILLLVQRLGIIVRDATSTILQQEAWIVISKQIMQKLPSVPYPLFEDNAFQARYGLVIREASFRSVTMVESLTSAVPILLGLIGVVITLVSIAPLMVLILLTIAIPAALIERRFSQSMFELQEHSAPMRLRMEALTNMQVDLIWQRDVRVYQSDLLGKEHASLGGQYLSQLKQLTWRFLRLRSAAALVQVIGLGLALGAAFALMSQGQLSLASLAILLPGVAFMSGMISSFIYQARSLFELLIYARALFDFLATSFETENTDISLASGKKPAASLSAIQVQDVSYTYPENKKAALVGISTEFKPGLTAIVGTNGAGKSTLVKLVAGLYVPTAGKIVGFDDKGEKCSLDDYLKSVLFQDPGHFPFSIRHNVTMRFEQVPGENKQIAEVLRMAGLWEAVDAMPDGLDTLVGAGFGGVVDLSGGQWQRLALARLLYHNSPLIILDEPSASLDPVGERQIFELLTSLAQEKIVLFTSHRYDTIRKAKTIVVLVDGKIAEIGTHDELERNAGEFWSLYLGQGSQA